MEYKDCKKLIKTKLRCPLCLKSLRSNPVALTLENRKKGYVVLSYVHEKCMWSILDGHGIINE